MENQMQAIDDKQAEVGSEKKPYEMPTLTKLGTVQQVTQGIYIFPFPDYGGLSA